MIEYTIVWCNRFGILSNKGFIILHYIYNFTVCLVQLYDILIHVVEKIKHFFIQLIFTLSTTWLEKGIDWPKEILY